MLCSPTDVKADSFVNFNVDEETIANAIKRAQSLYIEDIIGTTMLQKLQGLIYNTIKEEDDNINDEENAAYKELYYDYVKPALISKVVVEIITPMTFKLRNVGLTKNTDTNINVAVLSEMRYNQYYYQTDYCSKATLLSKYMGDNAELFPEFEGCATCGNAKNNGLKQPMLGKTFVNNGLFVGSDK